jgi:hypothetical protein
MKLNEMEGKRKLEVADFLEFFRSAAGKRALKQVDLLCKYNDDVFNKDPYIHAYLAGRRSISADIHKMLEITSRKEEAE